LNFVLVLVLEFFFDYEDENDDEDDGLPLRSSRAFFPFGKFKRHLAFVVHDEPGWKRTSGFGDKVFQQIRLLSFEQLNRLFAFDGLLQNGFADLEFARLLVALALFANITVPGLEHFSGAFRAFTQRLLAGEINLRLRFLWLLFLLGFRSSLAHSPRPDTSPISSLGISSP